MYLVKDSSAKSLTAKVIPAHGVRKYDYITGRFMAVDPLWEKYRGLNTYQYAANNPMIMIDPTGFATYYSKDKLILDDGVADGLEYVVPDDTDLSDYYLKDDETGKTVIGIDYESMKINSFLIPKTEVKEQIVNKLFDSEIMSKHKPNTEGAGVVATINGKEQYVHGGHTTVGVGAWKATSSDKTQKAYDNAQKEGGEVSYLVHTHPWDTETTPSPTDKSNVIPGIIINNTGVTIHLGNTISTVPLSVLKK